MLKKEPDFAKMFLYSIHQVYVLVQKHMEKSLNAAKALSFSQFWVLVCFIDCKDETNQTAVEVAKRMNITEATLSRHIDRLIKLKLIQKKRDPQNGRKFLIHLTDKGKDKFYETKKIIDKELQKIFNVVDVGNRKKAIEAFDQILKNLTK